MTFLLILFIATGLTMIGLALPLVYRKIPPNHLYGFRVKRTLKNREVWFAANAFAGQRLAWVGLATVVAAVVFYGLLIENIAAYATAVASVEMVGLLVAVVQSLRYLYGELGESSGSADSNKNARS
ncbi:MAG: SdpI family protein [Thermoguttaceae bacterium]